MTNYFITLKDDLVALEPLTMDHIEAMKLVCGDPRIWTWYTSDLTPPDEMENWMKKVLEESNAGTKMSYGIRLLKTGQIIGSTSYGHIDWAEKGIEIGWTWLGIDYIGKGINKHMKYLMLNHAFESMEIERLELRTDERNMRSRKAMEKIGASHDGTLRNHRRTRDGRRNTVIYSIIKGEWTEIKESIFKEF